ncbi:DUF5071 domain-containing protein [Paenibacillus sp. GCM10012307]|uniref:DUF5071 domain-containing protein n=1 Tax=Paenibacillus roseus TaxID=2798579 RepID=A0A934IZ22_9BACL|nr:DUF5071 domain-containing protein [Paenibacillus roseus]MBJ6361861.1 DUF5071 domain-containing protein [Paenibacillus roseus]
MDEFIPSNKMDYYTIEKLRKLPYNEIEPIINQLLEWVEDINWPIAKEICQILIPLDLKLVPSLKKIVGGKDEVWADNCIRYIVKWLSEEAIRELSPELERIAFYPSEDELELELNIFVLQLLRSL